MNAFILTITIGSKHVCEASAVTAEYVVTNRQCVSLYQLHRSLYMTVSYPSTTICPTLPLALLVLAKVISFFFQKLLSLSDLVH